MPEQTVQERSMQQTESSSQRTEQMGTGAQPDRGATQQASPLKTPRGSTHIDQSVVAKIAGVSAQEIEGVQMGGSAQRTVGGLMDRIGGGGGQGRGVSVEVGEVETAVDLTLAIEYGKAIPQITEAVRRNVIDRVESLVGLKVTEVNIKVDNVFFPGEQQEEAEQGPR
jgi:uncharacterized alkaline shock family protein YloU